MKNLIALLFILLSLNVFSQQEKLQGKWILDYIKYDDGGAFPINHRFYSLFMTYSFYGNQITINERSSLATIGKNTIINNLRTINYSFLDSYLMLQDQGDNTIMYLLKVEDFVEKYPEFAASEIQYENKKVFASNQILQPDFLNPKIFMEFMMANILSGTTQIYNRNFKANFILSQDNVVSDIVIVDGISNSFDKAFIKSLKSAQQYFSNKTGKNLLMTFDKRFYDWAGKKSQKQEEISYLLRTGDEYFNNNDFANAIAIYEKLKLKNTPEVSQRAYDWTSKANIRLGIAYLATDNPKAACTLFAELGGRSNFDVRNYTINFCE